MQEKHAKSMKFPSCQEGAVFFSRIDDRYGRGSWLRVADWCQRSRSRCFIGNLMFSSWWFQAFFIFTLTWGNDPIWWAFFSIGLKPPTSFVWTTSCAKESDHGKLWKKNFFIPKLHILSPPFCSPFDNMDFIPCYSNPSTFVEKNWALLGPPFERVGSCLPTYYRSSSKQKSFRGLKIRCFWGRFWQ